MICCSALFAHLLVLDKIQFLTGKIVSLKVQLIFHQQQNEIYLLHACTSGQHLSQ